MVWEKGRTGRTIISQVWVPFINTVSLLQLTPGSLHRTLITMGKEPHEFLYSGKSLARCGHKQRGVWRLSHILAITSPFAEGWRKVHMLFPALSFLPSHMAGRSKCTRLRARAVTVHQELRASNRIPLSHPADQQLTQGRSSEKIQWRANASVVAFFFSKGPRQANRTMAGLFSASLMASGQIISGQNEGARTASEVPKAERAAFVPQTQPRRWGKKSG